MSSVVESDADREVCLENVLAIDPDNKLAKSGLVHLRNRPAQPPPLLEPEPQVEPGLLDLAAREDPAAVKQEWWDQPQTIEAAAEFDDTWEGDLSPAAAAAVEAAGVEAEREKPQIRKRRRPTGASAWRLAILMLFVFGMLAATVAVAVVLRMGLLDPTKGNYANAMRPLLDEHEAWWEGPQGALTDELSSLCGPRADGWRNWDVLVVCSTAASADCRALAVHCGTNVEAMQEQVDELSREVQKTGGALLAAFDAISPPDDIAVAHAHFLTCLRTQVTDATRVGRLARGQTPANPDYAPACQTFSSAEAEIRTYVGSQ